MTFKRIMLVVLPVLAAVFVFMAFRWVYLDWEASLTAYHPVPRPGAHQMLTGGKEMPTPGGFLHDRTENLNLVRKDKTGRVEMRFLADVVQHRTDKTADIDRPRIQFFTKDGAVITLLADKGLAVTKGQLTNADDVESGRLWGNVVLVHDRATPDDDADDIFVSLDDLEFDNKAYEMSTDGPVVMVGGDMSLTARKMWMALDRDTRRIDTMKFFHDIFITFETSESMNFLQGDRKKEAAPAADTPTKTAAPSATDAAEPATAADEPGDLWCIDLEGNVDARQETQRLRCDHLNLYSASSPAGMATGAGTETGSETRDAAPKHGAADRRTDLDPRAKPLLIVIADGPLTITPVKPTERKALGDKQHQVTATGKPVCVEDGETLILGDTVHFNQLTGAGTVIGKDRPILLEQPGRLHLTGQRLDFDRNREPPTVVVSGEGHLQAKVPTASLTGSAGGGEPTAEADKPAEPSPLEASWKRGMNLELYSLPSDQTGGLGEIKSAAFHGQAVVEQADGVLKGDDLLIEFFRTEGDKGQAVQRLVGRGDVFLKNAEVPQTDAAKAKGPPPIGDIACQELEIEFSRDPGGATQPKRLEAAGDVAINDPEGKIRAQNLTVTFGRTEEGKMEARFLEAFGNVLIDRDDLHAEGDHVCQNKGTGTLLLEGKPARARRLHQIRTASGERVEAQSRVVGPRIEFAEAEGKARVTGAGELELPATTDLQGRPRDKPEPLIVQWTRGMLFEDSRNFAHFDGNVRTATGGSRLNAERLWIYFVDRPKTETQVGEGTETPAPESVAADETRPAGGGLGDLFGEKQLVRILAEKNVLAVEQQLADDGTVRHRMEIIGDNLTYLEQNRKAYVRGPGRLRILARERTPAGDAPKPGLAPEKAESAWKGDLPDGYARTHVGWVESMAYDGVGERAYFSGNVDAAHVGRGVPGEGETRRRLPTATRITSRDLQVVFAEKKPPAETTPTTEPPATPDTPRTERLTVEKLVADGSVLLWVDDRRGSAARLLYQREPEMIRLYRGPGADEWARLWQENEATQQFGLIAARTITYNPSSGRVDLVDQQVITMTPTRPKPVPKPWPKLVPGTKP